MTASASVAATEAVAAPVELTPIPPPRLYLTTAEFDQNSEVALGPAFPEYAWSERASVANIATVRRPDGDRPLDCDSGDLSLRKGETVVIETERGIELVLVATASRRRLIEGRAPTRAIRRAEKADLAAETRTRLHEAEAVRAAQEAVVALHLRAKVVRAEIGISAGRTTIYIAADERIEMRELARRLSSTLRGRIDLRLVGMRDAARAVGGIGPCGLQLCCNTFLADFAPVSIRMAKDQGLALNPQRVSGVCGRLMCCLVYEDAFYRAQRGMFPKPGKRVTTAKGEGIVRDIDVLGRTVRVSLADGAMESFSVEDVTAMTPMHGGGRDSRVNRDTVEPRDSTELREGVANALASSGSGSGGGGGGADGGRPEDPDGSEDLGPDGGAEEPAA